MSLNCQKGYTLQELIAIETTNINGAEIQSVNARELYEFLESKRGFSHWIAEKLELFEEGFDFWANLPKTPSGGRPRKEYMLTLDTAKHIAMLERNEKGKQIRQYFIEVEKRYNKPQDTLSEVDALLKSVELLAKQERRVQKVEAEIVEVKEEIKTLASGEVPPPVGYYSTSSLAGMFGFSHQVTKDILTRTKKGKKVRHAECIKLTDFGQKIRYRAYHAADFKKLSKWIRKHAEKETTKQYTCKKLFGSARRFENRLFK